MVVNAIQETEGWDELKNYELIRVLGAGGFGTCYEAMFKHYRVALKKLNRTTKTKAATQSFQSETLPELYRMVHPNIVPLLAASSPTCDEKFVVLQFIQGRNLQQVIDDVTNETFHFQRYVTFGIEIAKALDYISYYNIAHLDLKPANVLLSLDGVCKLTDFGCCQYVEKHPTTPTRTYLTGTFAYRAPELLKGNPASSKADVYSLGICLWQFWSRTFPYQGMNQHAVIFRVCASNLRPKIDANAEINEAYKSITTSCWSANLDERPTAKEVIMSLESML